MDASTDTPFGYVLYNYEDEQSLGRKMPGEVIDSPVRELLIDQIGQVLMDPDRPAKHRVLHGWVDGLAVNTTDPFLAVTSYAVEKTGYYCLRLANPNAGTLSVSMNFENPYGRLPPEFYPLYKATAVLGIVYAVGLLIWSWLSWQHRKHLVTLQKYIGIVLGLFMSEMGANYAFYYQYNATGSPSNLWMALVAIFSAIRATASLFFLLLVSMGYGVVIATLGDKTRKVYSLTAAHLLFSVINALSAVSAKDQSSLKVMILSVPVSVTYTIFFSWILSSLSATQESLSLRKQRGKLEMYRSLTITLYGFFAAAIIFMLAAMFVIFTYNSSQAWYAGHWRSLWFFSAGWPMFINVAACLSIGWIFRPQSYNRSYGLDELTEFPLDDDDLEIRATAALDSLRAEYANVDGHSRWNTGNLAAFGQSDSDDEKDDDRATVLPTAGSDGELAVHEYRDGALTTLLHKRIHKGAIFGLCAMNSERFATVGADGALHVTTYNGDSLSSQLIYRGTLPLRSIAFNGGLYACTGDEIKIVVVKEDATIVWSSETLTNFIVGLGWLSDGDLVSIDSKGKAILWSNGLFVLEADSSLRLIDHIRPLSAMQFCMTQVEEMIVLAHSTGLTVVSTGELDILKDISIKMEKIMTISGSSFDSLFLIGSDGNLSLVSSDFSLDPLNSHKSQEEEELGRGLPKKKKSSRDIFDTDEEESKTISRERVLHDESEDEGDTMIDELDDYNVASDMSVDDGGDGEMAGELQLGTGRIQLPECIHKPFQPSSTLSSQYRFLAWNTVGLITSRADDGYNSVEIEFHDRLFHRPIRFIDEVGYTMGSVGKTAAIFAKDDIVHIVPLDGVERAIPFSLELSDGEEVVGVAAGAGRYVAFATSLGYIRFLTPNNLQGIIANHPGKYVSMVANGSLLFLVHADEFSSELSYSLYDTSLTTLLKSGPIGGRFRNMRITWIGLSDNGIAGLFDEFRVLHIFNPDCNMWQPWLECREQRERKELVWPIGFTLQDFLCIVQKENEPIQPVPRPNQTMIPLRIPLVGYEESQVALYEKVFRTGLVLRGTLRPEISDKEAKRLQLVADKHVLELVRIAVKSDKPARALELCALFQMDKSWEIAVHLVRHERMAQLADRIEALKDLVFKPAEKGQNVVKIEGQVAPSIERMKTPKLSKRMAEESPGTMLSNMASITPGGDPNEGPLFKSHPISPISSKPINVSIMAMESVPSRRDPLQSSTLANPFAQLSFEEPAERKAQNFADVIKSVHSTTEVSEVIPKRVRTEPAILTSKSKKQSDLSAFAKRTTEENIIEPNEKEEL